MTGQGAVSIVIPHYFVARAPNLLRIAADLKRSTVRPCEILVWNNEPASTLPDLSATGMTVLQADHNYGCQARLMAARQAAGGYVLFMDNDTTVEPKTIASLLAWSARLPGAIVTLEGRVYGGDSYRRWTKYRGRRLTAPAQVAMSLGRGELVPIGLARRMLERFPFSNDIGLMDDLWWSACAAWEGIPIYVVPCVRGVSGLVNLPEGDGACWAQDYAAERDATISAIRAYGNEMRIWTDAA